MVTAQRLADPTVQARAHRDLARAFTRLGRFDDAHTHLRRALDLSAQAGDDIGQANTHYNLAWVLERQGRHTEALDCARQALDLYRAAGHPGGQAMALNAVGWLHTLLGDHQQSLTACQQALTLLQELGDHQGEAATHLGDTHHAAGDADAASDTWQLALDILDHPDADQVRARLKS